MKTAFPNYSLLGILACMVLTAAFFNIVYIPLPENLFRPYFLYEFTAVFLALAVFAFLYKCQQDGRIVSGHSFFHALVAFICIYGVLCLFSSMKSIIPLVNPHRIDGTLVWLEQVVHFGFMPTDLVVPALRHKWLYAFLDGAYFSWFFVIYVYVSLVVMANPYDRIRERYLFCFAAIWFLIGNIFAMVFSSVGPVFLNDFFNGDTSPALETVKAASVPFELYAEKAGLFAAFFEDLILQYVNNSAIVDPNAASAMPSVHVAMATLMAIHAWHINRWFFGAMLLYWLLVFAGSVLLCWHYAIDGYAAALMTYGLWRLSAFLPPPQKPQETAI